MLDLLGDHIDKLQLVAAATGKDKLREGALSPQEEAAASSRQRELLSSLPAAAEEREAALQSQLRQLLEEAARADRVTREWRERAERHGKQKDRLEQLSKELQTRNKKLAVSSATEPQPLCPLLGPVSHGCCAVCCVQEELRVATVDHQQRDAALRAKFDASLSSIQQQLSAHSTERDRQLSDSAHLKQHLDKLTAYQAAKDEHHAHELKTRELELQLAETRLQQAEAQLAVREREAAVLAAEAEVRGKREEALRQEMLGYGERMQAVQSVMAKSSDGLQQMQAEADRLRKRCQREQDERLKVEEKLRDSTAMLLSVMEERKTEAVEALRVRRQRDALQQLCQQLDRDRKQSREKDPQQLLQQDKRDGEAEEGKLQSSLPTAAADSSSSPAEA